MTAKWTVIEIPPAPPIPALPLATADKIRENLDYRERALVVSADQLISRDWAVGIHYRLTNSRLEDQYPDVLPDATILAPVVRQQDLRSTLHQVDLQARFNHPKGFFAQADALWTQQGNSGYVDDLPGDDFWQLNLLIGYRFPRRHAEFAIGLLNINNQDYKLNPLTPYWELPRERTFMARARLNF
jgi:hypothetical protein